MIKYREEKPEGWTIGISGIGNHFVYLNSRLILAIVRLLNVSQTKSLVYCVFVLTFLLIFIELYLINSIATGIFVLFYERFMFILAGTAVVFFFGRVSLPYWSEVNDDELD